MIEIKVLPAQADLLSRLSYDPISGVIWHKRMNKPTGAATSSGGYMQLYIMKKRYSSHRVVWKMMTGDDPKELIDHINGIRHDNRWANLREANRVGNNQNARINFGQSGHRGVVRYIHSDRPWGGKWKARISTPEGRIHLGIFDTIGEASAAYEAYAKELHGEFYKKP